MESIKKSKAPLLEQKGLSVAKKVSNCRAIMPGKSQRVNKPEVAREHVTYGESNGGQSGKLTA